MSQVIYRMVDSIVEERVDMVRKMKKDEIVEFASRLMKEYYLELDDEVIKEIYYKG